MVGIECCNDDVEFIEFLFVFNYSEIYICVIVERVMNECLEGGC